jgi:hypothetical protein
VTHPLLTKLTRTLRSGVPAIVLVRKGTDAQSLVKSESGSRSTATGRSEDVLEELLVAGAPRKQGCAALSFVCAAPAHVCNRLERLGFRFREGTKIIYGRTGDALANAAPSGLERWDVTDADEDQ